MSYTRGVNVYTTVTVTIGASTTALKEAGCFSSAEVFGAPAGIFVDPGSPRTPSRFKLRVVSAEFFPATLPGNESLAAVAATGWCTDCGNFTPKPCL